MENIGKQIAEVTEKATHFVNEALHISHNVLVTGRIFITGSKVRNLFSNSSLLDEQYLCFPSLTICF